MEWQDIAHKLPLGHNVRWKHCGKDAAASIYHTEEGISFFCHRCGTPAFEGHGYRNYKELLEVKARNAEALKVLQQTTLALPKNFSLDIPKEGMLWLLKASITPHMARQAGWGWDTYFQRVILPVYNDGTLVYYQARAVLKGQDPKYLNPKVDRASVIYWRRHTPRAKRVVVTEDILSAERTFLATPDADTASILGTKITIEQANQLSEYNEVITWLDPDLAGINGAIKVHKLVGLTSHVRNVTSKKDPKLLPNKKILEKLHV